MKKLIQEVENEGMVSLLGKKVMLMCMNYIYHGTLVGVNDTCVLLKNPSIVYETGAWLDTKWKDAQALPGKLYVQVSAIESFGEVSR
jgi:hypothetical protein